MDKTSEVIYALKPVSFRYKAEIEPMRPVSFGLIAEDVEEANPDLVTRGDDGKINSVRYQAVNAMLLNEFLKEHRKNEEQQAVIARLIATDTRQQEQIEALTAALQKVSAQIEASKPAPQTVNNP
jgi:Chaperone of endosialidase